VNLLLPSVHPHTSEPVITDIGFSIELWIDWLVPANVLESFEMAAADMAVDDRLVGRVTLRGRVTVERTVLWLSVTASGPGPADDGVWALAEEHFRLLWAQVHERAQIGR
jgi:hypothetical protein